MLALAWLGPADPGNAAALAGRRSGNGRLTLYALSRTLPLEENEKTRSKRLYRLLRNAALDCTQMIPLLVGFVLGMHPSGWILIVVDQTEIHGTQVLTVGIRVAHRVLPVAFTRFEYPLLRKSQNVLENALPLLAPAPFTTRPCPVR